MEAYRRVIQENEKLHAEVTRELYEGLEGLLDDQSPQKIEIKGTPIHSQGFIFSYGREGFIAAIGAQYYSDLTREPTNGFLVVKAVPTERDGKLLSELDALMKCLKFEKLDPADQRYRYQFDHI